MRLDKSKINLIAISGLAGSGKNTLAKIIKDNYPLSQPIEVSLAEPLRDELDEFLLNKFDISAFTDDRIDKELIRPILVSYASARRRQTSGLYFIKKLHAKLIKMSSLQYKVTAILTDLRFKEYNYDELDYCKENGIVIHISKYNLVNKGPENIVKEYSQPPNETEAKNNPIIKENADFHIEWPDLSGKNNYINELSTFCNPVLDTIFKKDAW